MKRYFPLFSILLITTTSAISQQKLITQAIVSTTTNVIAPEEEEQNNLGAGGGRMNFANAMDGEMKSTTWLKDDMVKTLLKSDVIKSTIYRNNATKLTTTLMQVMGNQFGFYVTDSEQTELKKKADSMMQNRRKNDTSATAAPAQPHTEPVVEIVDASESKKIAGYQCKKVYVISTRILGLKDTVAVWYSPEIRLKNINSTGGLSGFGNMASVNGLDKIDGFVMRYEMNMRRNRRMEVEVTKIDLTKEIADKEFDIPKDIEIKPMREMQNMFGGRGGGFGMPRP
ncbi:MAG: DUF4412 domain-containing protein [Ferruginibacter sp.]